VIAPGSWTLECDEALGPEPQIYQWYAGTSRDTSSPIEGATASSYTAPPPSGPTNYWVRVSNPYGPDRFCHGDADDRFRASHHHAATEPDDSVGIRGDLQCDGNRTGPLAYQWYTFDPVFRPIDGATESSYATGLVDGRRDVLVRVSDTLGTVQSAFATITDRRRRRCAEHHDAAAEPDHRARIDGDVERDGDRKRTADLPVVHLRPGLSLDWRQREGEQLYDGAACRQ